MSEILKSNRIFLGLSISAFFFWALALAVPTGYSYGAVGILLFSLLGFKGAVMHGIDKATWRLAGLLVVIGLLWGSKFDGWLSWSDTDYWAKYWVAAFCMVVVAYRGIDPRSIPWALAGGSLGAMAVALYQYHYLGISKASGFTNAIQYGGIAMYLGIATWTFALLGGYQRRYSFILWILGSFGVLASVLSETRGAWVVAPLLLLAIWMLLLQYGHRRLAVYAVITSLFLGVVTLIPLWERVEGRVQQALVETHAYRENPEQAVNTSIGQRLEQWQLAWRLGMEQPFTGWGVEGFVARKKEYVDLGWADPSVNEYGHAHNEILDMFAKRGLIGVSGLLLFYVIPLAIFWPSRRRIYALPAQQQKNGLALRTVASLLPIAYFGFGWTQVFFAHNSGHMFYIFSLVALWGGICSLEGKTRDDKTA